MAYNTATFIIEHCRRYPQLRVQDLLKALHQSAFGCGHLIEDVSSVADNIQRELKGSEKDCTKQIEPLDGEWERVHLSILKESGLRVETLAQLLFYSAKMPQDNVDALDARLSVFLELAEKKLLPFSFGEVSEAVERWRRDDFCACRHSDSFRENYAPAYRVLHSAHTALLPVLTAIDREIQQKDRVLLAIEGGSASGKTTLAEFLTRIYDCSVFHMDDYFRPFWERKPEDAQTLGNNVDSERFEREVLLPLSCGKPVNTCAFDCETQSFLPLTMVMPTKLIIVEGAYSMLPTLEKYYDCSIFLQIEQSVQQARIKKRNTPESQKLFFERWIPDEMDYFQKTNTKARCKIVLDGACIETRVDK